MAGWTHGPHQTADASLGASRVEAWLFYGSGFAGLAIAVWALGFGAGSPSSLSGPEPYVLIKRAWLLGARVKWLSLPLSDAICEWSPVGSGQFPGLDVGTWAVI